MFAQGQFSGGGGVKIIGAFTVNDCAKILSRSSIGSAGAACGAGASSGTVTSVLGTANQIISDGSTTTPLLSISTTFIAPGTLSAVTSIDATKLLGNLPALNGASLTSLPLCALCAPLASPGLTGTPTAPTAAALTGSTQLASTAYADNNFKSASIGGFRDDFLATSIVNCTTGGIAFTSDSGIWSCYGVAATATAALAVGTYINPGQVSLTTGATSGNGGGFNKGNSASAVFGALGSNAGWEANFVVKISATSSVSLRVGLANPAGVNTDPPTDGFWVDYDTANGSSGTNFTWRTCAASVCNYDSTNAIAADTSFHRFRIRSTTIGTILFSVDGGTEKAITTNVSTAVVNPFVQIQTRTTATKALTVDYISYMSATGRL